MIIRLSVVLRRNVMTNSPSQAYTHPNDLTLPTYKNLCIYCSHKTLYVYVQAQLSPFVTCMSEVCHNFLPLVASWQQITRVSNCCLCMTFGSLLINNLEKGHFVV